MKESYKFKLKKALAKELTKAMFATIEQFVATNGLEADCRNYAEAVCCATEAWLTQAFDEGDPWEGAHAPYKVVVKQLVPLCGGCDKCNNRRFKRD